MIGTVELVAAAGVTYRQVDYWTRAGVFECDNPAPGSGTHRQYPESELVKAELIGALRRSGFTVQVAGSLAARLAVTGRVDLGEGLSLLYTDARLAQGVA